MRANLAFALVIALLGLVLGPLPSVRADPAYTLRSLVRPGDRFGEVVIHGQLNPGTLNDRGQLVFSAENEAGVKGRALLLYADNQVTPLVVGGTDGPIGKWPSIGFNNPIRMNQQGNVAVSVGETPTSPIGVFRWDAATRQLTPVALKGMPAVNGLTFEFPPGGSAPQINNHDEIAFVARMRNQAGEPHNGIFFLGRDGKLLPVALPDQDLLGGGKVRDADVVGSVNDTGVVSLLVRREGEGQYSAYLWEQGKLTPIAVPGQETPDGDTLFEMGVPRLNNKNRDVLLLARLKDQLGARALYRWREGRLLSIAVPGQPMPEGGTLVGVQEVGRTGGLAVGYANELGQHAFLADLDDGRTAAYRVDPDGRLFLILASSTETEVGSVVRVGSPLGPGEPAGVTLNSQGQVVLSIATDPVAEMIVLLTPKG